MNSATPTRQQLSQAIEELPSEVLPELANFIEYLQFKVSSTPALKKDEPEESNFLMSIAGLGESEETDLSERDEEILKSEVDPIRGFSHQGHEQ
ncbi:DUF2281 domain-containing protein [Aerosakkonemataceae cyanobacterium BLCC-F154]|uniref:DUF2281 domain-containing protein n=1 Tax=Floridaenema fluviatile BLCC-F154 TaxID=3153640 RepID=A0ABV4YEL8_9CYAN